MYALVEIKGKQYKAEKDAVLKVDKLDNETGDKIEFDSVLLVSDKSRCLCSRFEERQESDDC